MPITHRTRQTVSARPKLTNRILRPLRKSGLVTPQHPRIQRGPRRQAGPACGGSSIHALSHVEPHFGDSSVVDFTGGVATPSTCWKFQNYLGEASPFTCGNVQTSPSGLTGLTCTGDLAADALPPSMTARLTGELANSSGNGGCEAAACSQQPTNTYPKEGVVVNKTSAPCISPSTLQLLEKVGQGSFGKVYKCMWLGRLLAVKIKVSDGAVDHEIETLTVLADGLGHRGISRLMSWRAQAKAKRTFLFFPLAEEDLRALISRHRKSHEHLPIQDVTRFIVAVCSAASYMHSRGVLHRDLKPNNILVRRNFAQPVASGGDESELPGALMLAASWVPVIADFGNALNLGKNGGHNLPTRRCGTLPYCAPEVLLPGVGYTYPSDVWSMGLILSEIESLHLVVACCASSDSYSQQLLRVWQMCHAVGATQQGEWFEVRVLQELRARLPWSVLGKDTRYATLGRVYGSGFGVFAIKFLHMNPLRRSSFAELEAHLEISDFRDISRQWR